MQENLSRKVKIAIAGWAIADRGSPYANSPVGEREQSLQKRVVKQE